MAAQRLVSVIVPTRDRPALLRQALASIRALEGPDLTFEILVCDNGTALESRNAADEFGAIYLKAAASGASAARNVGIRAATGEFLAFLDDDDVWLPENVRPHIALLDAQPSLDGVVGQFVFTDSLLVPTGAPSPQNAPAGGKELLKRMLGGFFPQIGTTVMRTSVREKIGYFDEELIGGEDLDWLLRTARPNRLGFLAVPCILFRGRPAGSFDALQRLRIGYDRRVFFRHALPAWRIWNSPLEFSRAYSGTLMHFYRYFVDAAVERAERGERKDGLRALVTALSIFPLRGTYHLITVRPVRKAFLALIFRRRRLPPARLETPPGGETRFRSIVKAISWRATGSLDTFVISWIVTGRTAIAGSIAGTELLTKILLYYFHERIWAVIPWGHGRSGRIEPSPRDQSYVELNNPETLTTAG